ncbi:aryl-sulfate sulfotransferase [Hoeflea sp. CAU 1731]
MNLPVDQVTLRRRSLRTVAYDASRSAGGLVLYAPQASAKATLAELDGCIVHEWSLPTRPGRHAVLLANGNLGLNGAHAQRPDYYPAWDVWQGGLFLEITLDDRIVWSHEDDLHHHDGRWLANGNLLYTTAEPLPAEIGRRVLGGRPGASDIIVGDVVKEVDRSGETVWEWRSWEHIDPVAFPINPVFDRNHWPLINGLHLQDDGLVLMSLRTTSGIIAVDRKSGDIVWTIGPELLAQQHSPVGLSNGNVLAFDNGNYRPGIAVPYSRIVEIDPRTNTVVWEYSDPMKPSFFSPYMGSVQPLANGNLHITESAMGRLFEVTRSGEVVWEYVVPEFNEYPAGGARTYAPGLHNSVFQSFRYQHRDIPWL